MISKKVLINIYNDLLELSSKDLQISSWITGEYGKESSYVELICRIFDDDAFEEFIEKDAKELGLPPDFILKLEELKASLEEYEETNKTQEEIINDPQWIGITHQAKDIIEYWDLNISPLLT